MIRILQLGSLESQAFGQTRGFPPGSGFGTFRDKADVNQSNNAH
jgi:hypothetical protein